MFDWFTFSAQIVNFLILVWLLNRFLYSPVTKAMDKREQDIKELFEEADAKTQAAESKQLEFVKELKHIDELKQEKLDSLEKELRSREKEMLKEAKERSKALEASFSEALEEAKRRIHNEFRREIQIEILDAIRKIIDDLADSELEEQMVKKFMGEFTKNGYFLPVNERRVLPHEVKIRSSFPLKKHIRESLEKLIAGEVQDKFDLVFETREDNLPGIEMIVDGQKAEWTVSNYLASLDNKFLRG